MKTRNINRKEAHDIGREVFVHMADSAKGGDKDFKGTIHGYKNVVQGGMEDLQVLVEVEGRDYWWPICRIFVEDETAQEEEKDVGDI